MQQLLRVMKVKASPNELKDMPGLSCEQGPSAAKGARLAPCCAHAAFITHRQRQHQSDRVAFLPRGRSRMVGSRGAADDVEA